MTGVITGDIVNSRKVADPGEWLSKLKANLSAEGPTPKTWEVTRGDSFQVEIIKPEDALKKALHIKALIKCTAGLDVRMAIGVGTKTYDAPKISETNGDAFVRSGRLFDQLKKNTLAISSPWEAVDKAINTCLELASLTMDRWTPNSAEIIALTIENPEKTQFELGNILQISQGRVSERQQRAGYEQIMKMEAYFRESILQKTTG